MSDGWQPLWTLEERKRLERAAYWRSVRRCLLLGPIKGRKQWRLERCLDTPLKRGETPEARAREIGRLQGELRRAGE